MAWELSTVVDQRKELIRLYEKTELSMTEICECFGVSRKTGYKWVNRYEESGELGLLNLPKGPIIPKRVYSTKLIESALLLKGRYPRWGPKKILAILEREHPDISYPCAARLYQIFKDKGLTRKRRFRKRVPATNPLANVAQSNDTWSGDFKGWFLTKRGEKCEPLTVIDAQTRFVIRCVHLERKTAENVWLTLSSSFREFGLPRRFRTDNGPPFGSVGVGRLTKLSVNLIKAGVQPEWIDPGHPEQNGRHERFHLTLKEEVEASPGQSLLQRQKWMNEFVEEFNFDRPHEALEMETPGSIYARSLREWDGILRSPEYNSVNGELRKVGASGGIWFKGKEYFIGQVLSGEYIQLKESNEGKEVHYGSLYLGRFRSGNGLEKPKTRIRSRNVDKGRKRPISTK